MKQDDYLKVKDKYEAVLYELMKEVSNQLDYDDCDTLYKEMALSLITASIDLDRSKNDVIEFSLIMIRFIDDVMNQIETGQYNGKVIKQIC